MTLDDILKEHAAWMDQASRQPLFAKVSEKDIAFPEDLRNRRAAEITAAIDALSKRRDETVSLYEAAIDGYKKELEALKSAPAAASAPSEGTDKPAGRRTKASARTKPD